MSTEQLKQIDFVWTILLMLPNKSLMTCLNQITDELKNLTGQWPMVHENKFEIGDLEFQDRFLFITDLNYGVFVLEFNETSPDDFDITSKYLYRLTSKPNRIHIEKPNHTEYIIMITAIASNKVLIFDPIPYKTKENAESILKLDSVNAFKISTFYSFGIMNSINNDFVINELYNSMEKQVSIRISSREDSRINDPTIKVLDLDISSLCV
jgi:hypothetical protein